ncbi:glycosyltransferase [Photobacterium makurazakiensis]|uniref:glycosyltransferase n=1 Tax=Photobacterium makurazakiensis TaxID=2910234 RepID=UPI003D0E14B0
MSKRILFVVHNLKIGGIQKITLDTARFHANQGNDVTILLLEDKVDLNVDFNCKIEHIALSKYLLARPWLALFYGLYKAILRKVLPKSEFVWAGILYRPIFEKFIKKNNNFNAIFINGVRSMNHLHSIDQTNVVYSLHLPHSLTKNSNNTPYYNFLFKKLFSNKRIFTVSDFIRQPIQDKVESLGVDLKALKTIYNPCDINKISTMANEPIDYPSPYILGVGRLTKQKRFDRLIEAYKKANIKPNLIILGDGNQKEALEQQISQLGLQNKVFLKGFDKNPFRWMKNANFFVLSSDVEGFVLVINEALACGTPVVATNCGPVTEILSGELSKGIADKNSDDLAKKIQLFSHQPVTPSSEVIKKLTFDEIVKQQLSLLK